METKSAISEAMMVAFSTAVSVVPKKTSRNLSDFKDIAHLAVAVNGFALTPRQRLLITTSYAKWQKKKGNNETVGQWVHRYICDNYKDLKQILTDPKNKEAVELYTTTITSIIDMSIESLEYLDDALGPLFVSYTAEGGLLSGYEDLFNEYYWKCVCEALCQFGKELSYSRLLRYDTIYAFRIVILFISKKITNGFQMKHEGFSGCISNDNNSSCRSRNTSVKKKKKFKDT
uniref:Cyclin N-terminal domain-containing protein n=1 Tax=Strongyloides stercoralis TaxID=6248 RepID=A0A0K0EJW8_STRER